MTGEWLQIRERRRGGSDLPERMCTYANGYVGALSPGWPTTRQACKRGDLTLR